MKFVNIFIFIAGVAASYELGFKKGRSDLKKYLARETLNKVYPRECRRCPRFQENWKRLDLEETIIPILQR